MIAKRQSDVRPRIDVSAFVAVMLALLWIFIGREGPNYHPNPAVDLSLTSNSIELPQALREDTMIVTVTRDGKIYYGKDLISADQLPSRIREGVRSGSEKRIYINADRRTKYANVSEVVDQIRLTGVQNVSILIGWRQNGTYATNP